ncbi:MAG: M61 family metallopeptidase, partial [Caulobacteraceae bacterium]
MKSSAVFATAVLFASTALSAIASAQAPAGAHGLETSAAAQAPASASSAAPASGASANTQAAEAMAGGQPQPAAPSPAIAPPADVPFPGVIHLAVDATDLSRHIFQVHETIPVSAAGPMTLLLPQWLPGNHSPSGQIDKFAGL